MRFAAEALGVSYGSLRSYLYGKPLAGTLVVRLERLWTVEGHDVPVTTETAAEMVGCLPEEVRRIASRRSDRRVTCYRRTRWSLPHEVIDDLRDADRRRRALLRKRSSVRIGKAAR